MLQSKLNNYKNWWKELKPREQRLLTIGSLSLTIFVVYFFMWSPLNEATIKMRQQIKTSDQTLYSIEALNKEINDLLKEKNSLDQKNKSYSPAELISLLQNHIDKAGLKSELKQLKQTNNNNSEIHFQKVDFDKLSGLLIELNQQFGVKIIQVSIKNENIPGKVTADIVVSM